MEPLEPRPFRSPRRQAPKPVGVPRRFGMGVLLLITAMYAVLFGVLRAFGVPPLEFLVIAGFCTAVGLGQMLLFGGKMPRLASFVAGASAVCLMALLAGGPGDMLPRLLLAGGAAGYVVGCLIAGVFLVLKWFEKAEAHGDGAAAQDSPFNSDEDAR